MKRAGLVLLAGLFSICSASGALAVGTDFEAFPVGTPLAGISVPGVTFSAPAGNGWQVYGGYVNTPYAVDNTLATFSATALTITFSEPQRFVQFGFGSFGNSTIQAFNGTTVVQTVNYVGGPSAPFQWVSFESGDGITSVVIGATATDTVFDNLTATARYGAVPTLGTAALAAFALALAVAGAAIVRRIL
jgi:hypothetical protein